MRERAGALLGRAGARARLMIEADVGPQAAHRQPHLASSRRKDIRGERILYTIYAHEHSVVLQNGACRAPRARRMEEGSTGGRRGRACASRDR